jgi:DNA transformation protein
VAHCLELLEPVGPVRARRMFGGWGLHAQELFVALIADERLYLKVDDATEPAFRAAGGERFDFVSKGRTVSMRYMTPPADAMDSPALMAPWARLALGAALRARAASPPVPARAEAPEDDAGSSATTATRRRAMR